MINNENVISVETKQKLVSKLLNAPFVTSNTETQRLLAMYPSQLSGKRSQTICNILNKFLPAQQNLDPYAKFDLVLGLNKTRGHFVHQFEVFLVGLNILHLNWPNFIDLAQDSSKIDTVPKMLRTWAITASAHDIGYPMSAASAVANAIGALYSEINLNEIAERFIKSEPLKLIEDDPGFFEVCHSSGKLNIIEYITTALKRFIDIEDANAVLDVLKTKNNHGFLSAVLITKLLYKQYTDEFGARFKDQWEYDSLELAVGAIALHAIDFAKAGRNIFKQADSKKNIFAYLLFIVDNIQDWDRNIFEGNKYPEYFLRNVLLGTNDITLEYYITHEKWNTSFEKEAISFVETKELLKSVFPPPGIDITVNVLFKSEDGSVDKRVTIAI